LAACGLQPRAQLALLRRFRLLPPARRASQAAPRA
ncbi:hypothetical protein A2U01_0073928, partial [Trifolium medium]|nr:hypothetical protein [Trifolium medium]